LPELINTAIQKETAILIGVISRNESEELIREHLDELAFLVDTAGAITGKRFTQKLDLPDSRTFVGKGKLEEIKRYIKENDIDVAIFDNELSPSQLRNIEKTF